MDIFQSVVLGLTQGITEFIPVSSSGHLTIVEALLGPSGDFHFFLEWINIGTLLAMLIYFRHRIAGICRDVFIKHNFKLALNIIITCIPAGLAGLLLSNLIENSSFFSSMFVLAVMLAAIGFLMIFIDKLPHLSKLKNENQLTPGRALLIGCAQILALIPGASRSGTTIITGRLMGLNNKSAAEYSFLVAIPLMLAVCLKGFISSPARDYLFANFGLILLANLVAFAVGFAAVRFIMKFLAKPKSLQPFGYYRITLATVVLIFALLAA